MTTSKQLFFVAFIFVSAIALAWAFQVGPVEFANRTSAGPTLLVLKGAGLKKFLGIQVVTVAFYMPARLSSQLALTDIPKRLEVVYLQNIPQEELQRATSKGIRKNISKEEYLRLQPKIEAVNSMYPDVRKGDKITVVYTPQDGLKLSVNEVYKGTVPGADIARAFFAIWVGEAPVDAAMKAILLGEKNGPNL